MINFDKMQVYPNSNPGIKSELMLFDVPLTQQQIIGQYLTRYSPFSTVSETQFSFQIPESNDWTDLGRSFIQLTLELECISASASDPASWDVALVNDILNSLFSKIDVSIGGTTVSDSNPYSSYKSVISHLVAAPAEVKQTHLRLRGYYEDSANSDASITNVGWKWRKNLTADGKKITLIGPINSELFQQPRPIIPRVPLTIIFHRNENNWVLFKTSDNTKSYKVNISNPEIHIRRLKIDPEYSLALEEALQSDNVKYPIVKQNINTIHLAANGQNFSLPNLHQGKLPKTIFCVFVSDKNMQSNDSVNPYEFSSFNIQQFTAYVDQDIVPGTPINFKNNETFNFNSEAYKTLLDAVLPTQSADRGIGISFDDYFKKNKCVIALDLSADPANKGYNRIRQGTLRFDLQFSKPLTEAICLIILELFDQVIEISANRSVIRDFSI